MYRCADAHELRSETEVLGFIYVVLFRHCQRGDLIEIFNHLNYYDINPTTFFMPAKRPLHEVVLKLLVRSNFFTQRVINSWNNLPDKIISCNTVRQFKAKLDRDWESGYGFEHRLLA